MLRKLLLSLSLVLMAVLAVAPATMAQDKVTGDVSLTWNDCWAQPGDEVPDWIGTIELDGNAYDMVFFNLGDGRPPNADLAEPLGAFIEIWAVYDGLEIAFDEACAVESYQGDLVMWGHDAGVSDHGASEYAMTGSVVEAIGDYADLAGQPLFMSGTFFENDAGVMEAPGVVEIG